MRRSKHVCLASAEALSDSLLAPRDLLSGSGELHKPLAEPLEGPLVIDYFFLPRIDSFSHSTALDLRPQRLSFSLGSNKLNVDDVVQKVCSSRGAFCGI